MKISVIALCVTAASFWGAVMLIAASANWIWPSYGGAFLELLASVYPGYHPGLGITSILVGTFYGIVDGAIGGALFAWIYNLLSSKFQSLAD